MTLRRPVSLFALMLAVLTLAACGQKDQPASAKPAVPARELSSSDMLRAANGTLAELLPFTGTLKPLNEAVVASKVDGTVLEVSAREGELVKKGQVLARIDRETLSQNVAEQEAQLANQQARLKLAQVKLDKQRELFARGFISKLALDEQASDFEVQAGVLKAQQAQLARAREALGNSEIKAPINGVVYERKKNPGDLASRNDRLFAIADLAVLEIAASLPARLGPQLAVGMDARFSVEGQAGEFSGKLVRINPVANASTRNFDVYLRVDNQDGRLKAGQFTKGGIVLRELSGVVVLPLAAVHERDSKPWVLLVDQGRLARRPVTVKLRSEALGKVAVDGITPGAAVVAVPLIGMQPGDAVRLPAAK